MRTLPNMRIFQPCDNASTKIMANLALESSSPIYLRLDRYGQENLIGDTQNIAKGISVIRPITKITLLASGNMIMTAIEVADKLIEKNIKVGVVDACIFPINKNYFYELFSEVKQFIVLEEHTLVGGIGSHILELISDLNMNIRVKRFGLNISNGYIREYGGRHLIHKKQGMNSESIISYIMEEKNETTGCIVDHTE